MPGKQASAIFDSGAPLHGRFSKISELSGNVRDHSDERDVPPGNLRHEMPQVKKPENDRAADGGERALPTLLWAHDWRKLVSAESLADVVSRGITSPIEG